MQHELTRELAPPWVNYIGQQPWGTWYGFNKKPIKPKLKMPRSALQEIESGWCSDGRRIILQNDKANVYWYRTLKEI